MSYCVNCGVKLREGTKVCPLCNTPVINPNDTQLSGSEPFFPTRQESIQPVSKKASAIVLTSMFASVAICCGLLNLAMNPEMLWSLYTAGAALMFWIWFVVPLLWRKMPFLLRISVNMCAMAVYVFLIAVACGGMQWYWRLALPILLSAGVIGILICWMFRNHSRLTSLITTLWGIGLFCAAIEVFTDLFLRSAWIPGWSLIVLTVAIGFSIPLIVIRTVPSLREEARRVFHL